MISQIQKKSIAINKTYQASKLFMIKSILNGKFQNFLFLKKSFKNFKNFESLI